MAGEQHMASVNKNSAPSRVPAHKRSHSDVVADAFEELDSLADQTQAPFAKGFVPTNFHFLDDPFISQPSSSSTAANGEGGGHKKKFKTDTRLNIEHERLKVLKEYVRVQKSERDIYRTKYEAELEYLKQKHKIEKDLNASKQALVEQHRSAMNDKLDTLNRTLHEFSTNVCSVLKQNIDVQKQVLDILKTSSDPPIQYHHHQ